MERAELMFWGLLAFAGLTSIAFVFMAFREMKTGRHRWVLVLVAVCLMTVDLMQWFTR